ncbi:hypothetical protein ABT160_31280 [Streptomyces sp. NPDC001941]|uniref:hypothetical protein n=1 Tax=Streptomyces sp. NPDC001941 TaxID=3154659 RepID=UPI003326ACB8
MVVQHRRGRGAVAVAAAVVSVAALAGCSGQEADARPGEDPAKAVRGAARVLGAAGTARARTVMETASGGTRVTIRGEGGYDFARRLGQLRVVLPKDAAGADEHRPVTEVLAPGALYMKNRGAGVPADKWVRVDTTTLADGNLVTGGATDPWAAAELLRGARGVTLVGREELAGVAVRHYRGTADLGAAARAADARSRATLAAAAKGFSTDAVPFDAYLDDQGRLRKVRHRFSFGNRERAVAVVSTTLLYDFGAPVRVALPRGRDIYSGRIRA